MRKFVFVILSAFSLSTCETKKEPEKVEEYVPPVIEVEHDYSEVSAYQIKWENMFDQNLEKYYVYFYSPTCDHCIELKNWIIELALNRGDIFFVKSSTSVVISNDVKNTIGVVFAGDFSILGYPSMAEISSKKVTKNVAGKAQIKKLFV